jgi:D-lactate dehydrogenase
MRCTGYDHVDLQSAATLGLRIARVPGYSPHAVAEHAIGLMLVLLRRLHRAYNRVREGNFSLEGLLGSNLAGKTVAVLGTGSIGSVMAHILLGFGCTVLAYDAYPDAKLSAIGVRYVPLGEALAFADIITLHLPLTPATRHLIDDTAIAGMRSGAMIINTGRGGLLDTAAAINGLKNGRIGALGIDVYEHEGEIFFADHSDSALADDLFARLLTFPNVVVTGHQAFFTREALGDIATATMANLTAFERGTPSLNDLAL